MVRARSFFTSWSSTSAFFACAAACSMVPTVGCQPSENAVLLTATTAGDIETLSVVVITLDGERRREHTESIINRTDGDINDNDPLRIAIDVHEAHTVLVHVEATGRGGAKYVATRCIPVSGVIEDSVYLVSPSIDVDPDQDGFPVDPRDTCFAAEGVPCARFLCDAAVGGDCNEGTFCEPTEPSCTDPPQLTNPAARELCQDGLDQDCSAPGRPAEGDVACGDADNDGFELCSSATMARCDCDDENPLINPDAAETIVYDAVHPENNTCGDGIDQNCDGTDVQCDRDGDGSPANQETGGYPDCDDTNPEVYPTAMEVCTLPGGTPTDEDCNGRVDELADCAPDDMDNDGVAACGTAGAPAACDCNDCDAGILPSAVDRCNDGIDQNCDGFDATCAPNDTDGDGVNDAALGGTDCDDTNPAINPNVAEICDNGVDDNCVGGENDGCPDGDMDNYVESGDCEMDRTRNPGVLEVCDLVDNDCDMTTDEVFSPPTMVGAISFVNGETGCVRSNPTTETCADDGTGTIVCAPCAGDDTACVIDFRYSFFHCSGCRIACDLIRADKCTDGTCVCAGAGRADPCPDGTRCCAGGCPSLTDPANCNGCGSDCNAGRAADRPAADMCVDNACSCGGGAACADGQMCCGGACVPFNNNDSNNCGACGNRCAVANGTPACVDGTCRIGSCNALFADCDGAYGGGCETSLETTTDCGACGTSCSRASASATCAGGTCRIGTCNPGTGNCDTVDGNGCEQPLNVVANCAACGTACARANATPTCTTGACGIQMCNGGFGNCNGGDGDGCEQPLNTTSHCGMCGRSCARANATPTCSTGSCAIQSCNSGFRDCDSGDTNGCETALGTTSNCLDCADVCMAPANAIASCGGSGCGWACNTSFHNCSGACVSNNNVANCGTSSCMACATPPGSTATCNGTACGYMCVGGTSDCDGSPANGCECAAGRACCSGACVNLMGSDATNCGGCGVTCGPGETCNAGVCRCGPDGGTAGSGPICTATETCCGTGCENTDSNPMHCGGCGMTCGGSETCVGGACCCGTTCGASGGGERCLGGGMGYCCVMNNSCVANSGACM